MWYGIDLNKLPLDAAGTVHSQSRLLELSPARSEEIEFPELDDSADLRRTSYLSRELMRWGKLPASLLKALDVQSQKYAFLGTEDWSMYPILMPGSFLLIDETKTKVSAEHWMHEIERPIYFLEHRSGFRCGWCSLSRDTLIWQPHWSAQRPPEIFKYPGEIEIVGRVTGVAMKLGSARRRHTHF